MADATPESRPGSSFAPGVLWPVPSLDARPTIEVRGLTEPVPTTAARLVPIPVAPAALAEDPDAVTGPQLATALACAGLDPVTCAGVLAAGFEAAPLSTLVLPGLPVQVLVAIPSTPHEGRTVLAWWRDAIAEAARALPKLSELAVVLPTSAAWELSAGEAAPAVAELVQAATEAVLLGRWSFEVLHSTPATTPVTALTILVDATPEQLPTLKGAATRGQALARTTLVSRDLASTPPAHLTARRLAEVAVLLGARFGFEVEVFDERAIAELGLGGLMGVNRGSVEPARLVKLSYLPVTPTASSPVGLVGKGITYDSGGLSIKPSDEAHAMMKIDMSGASAVLGAFCAFADLDVTVPVLGWLLCTDNLPSGSALALGDVLTMRDGSTVEVVDTDAEGRLVLADGLCLAREAGCRFVVDIATLTGSCERALGAQIAGVLGTAPELVAALRDAGLRVDELLWEMPLHLPYASLIAAAGSTGDIKNWATRSVPDVIQSSLFLSRFVGELPWAHLDIAGPSWSPATSGHHVEGPSGWGARLLAELLATTPA